MFCFHRVRLATHLEFVAGVASSHFQERSRDSVFKYTCLRRHESVGRQILNTFWNRWGAGMATAFTYDTLEMLPSFREPSRLLWPSLQGLCFASQRPALSREGPPRWLTRGAIFISEA